MDVNDSPTICDHMCHLVISKEKGDIHYLSYRHRNPLRFKTIFILTDKKLHNINFSVLNINILWRLFKLRN